jgi:hypothetical protein
MRRAAPATGPGDGGIDYASFYSYAYPTPDGFKDVTVPKGAFFDEKLGEFLSYFPHISGMISREFSGGGVDQPRNTASGTPSSSRVWLWMPVSSGRNT